METNPVSNVDRLVLLLRERLSERAKAARAGASSRGGARRTTPAETVRALAGVEGMDERHLRRALVQNLLLESFGEKVVYDAQFQQVIERVTQTIEADPSGANLLQRLVRELKEEAAR
jgi:methylmalonyl-CoA mutase cobalamin-binding subunit